MATAAFFALAMIAAWWRTSLTTDFPQL